MWPNSQGCKASRCLKVGHGLRHRSFGCGAVTPARVGARWLGGPQAGPGVGGAVRGALPIASSRRPQGSRLSCPAPRAPVPPAVSPSPPLASPSAALLRCGTDNVAGLGRALSCGGPRGRPVGNPRSGGGSWREGAVSRQPAGWEAPRTGACTVFSLGVLTEA